MIPRSRYVTSSVTPRGATNAMSTSPLTSPPPLPSVDSDHLKIHMRTHDSQKPYQCSVCNRGYRTAAALTSHLQKHRDREAATPAAAASTGEAQTQPYRCLKCAATYSTGDALQVRRRFPVHRHSFKQQMRLFAITVYNSVYVSYVMLTKINRCLQVPNVALVVLSRLLMVLMSWRASYLMSRLLQFSASLKCNQKSFTWPPLSKRSTIY